MSRALMLAGAGAIAVSVLLPWVTITGKTFQLDLGVIHSTVSTGSRTVSGTGTSLWPGIVFIAALVAVLALLSAWRGVVIAAGLIIVFAGVGLLYYVANVLEIETRDDALKRIVADAALDSSIGPGVPLLLAGGVAVLAGALLRP